MSSQVAGEGEAPFRVFFIPFFVPSHMIPMTKLACEFAARGVDSTVVVTPANDAIIRPFVDQAARTGHPVHILHYPFPSSVVGLPEGVESLATVHPAEEGKIYQAVDAVQGEHGRILREHCPDAVVADVPYWWTTDVARELGIPRVTFFPMGAFPLTVMNRLNSHRPFGGLADGDNRPFLVPGLPDPVEMVKSELPNFLRFHDQLTENWDRIKKANLECFGGVVNTFYELETKYCDQFRHEESRDVFYVGPLSKWLRGEVADKKAAAKGAECMAWLDKQAAASVAYVAFGSYGHFSKQQHWEMARGLEASGRPFLWALKERVSGSGGADWLPEGFEERVRGRGLVVRGWLPQEAILNHRATGAFVTHLGWNSTLEGLASGLPMITWPLAFEQFINERLVVKILRVGVRMWEGPRSSVAEEAAQLLVTADAIARVVSRFAAPGEADAEVEAMRKRARKYTLLARAAVSDGGSSWKDIDRLIDALKTFRLNGGEKDQMRP
ncbi:hypothetical protein Taro_049084 [Colocasia esculenta]|uniref:Glycosyltransferase n=1 Tax=Colocasia esculenta TaxID=4460 RepID=A0A843XA03_COLES|nr:hypothetical protein [Colocasia esculenta]